MGSTLSGSFREVVHLWRWVREVLLYIESSSHHYAQYNFIFFKLMIVLVITQIRVGQVVSISSRSGGFNFENSIFVLTVATLNHWDLNHWDPERLGLNHWDPERLTRT